MKRLFLLVLLVACSSNEDDTVVDASLDQSQEATTKDATADVVAQDAVKQDVTTADSSPDDASDATTNDVIQIDAAPDVLGDAVVDAIIDAPIVDAITLDVKNGCVDNNACNSNQFCDKGTGNCNGVGTCTAIPQFCQQLVFPVCGCDKQTYINSCYANKGLTSVAYNGACE